MQAIHTKWKEMKDEQRQAESRPRGGGQTAMSFQPTIF